MTNLSGMPRTTPVKSQAQIPFYFISTWAEVKRAGRFTIDPILAEESRLRSMTSVKGARFLSVSPSLLRFCTSRLSPTMALVELINNLFWRDADGRDEELGAGLRLKRR